MLPHYLVESAFPVGLGAWRWIWHIKKRRPSPVPWGSRWWTPLSRSCTVFVWGCESPQGTG